MGGRRNLILFLVRVVGNLGRATSLTSWLVSPNNVLLGAYGHLTRRASRLPEGSVIAGRFLVLSDVLRYHVGHRPTLSGGLGLGRVPTVV